MTACRVPSFTAVAATVVVCAILVPASAARAASTSVTGGGQPINNVQPATVVSYIIATQGMFPSRNGSGNLPGTLLGEVRRFAGNFAPGDWAFADGQIMSIAQNPALFSLLGTTYGGDGKTTFGLPDLRGRTAIHQGQGPGLATHFQGDSFGAETATMDVTMLPAHQHASPVGNTDLAGGGGAFENRMPSLALNFIICVAGAFPSQSGTTADNFLGEVRMFAGNFAPDGWATTDGQLLPIAQNAALFSLLGTTYGGNGQTTFALPDLRGRAPLQAGSVVGLTSETLGQQTGQETITLTTQQMAQHTHTINGFTTNVTGGGQPHSNLQPTLALTDLFAVQATFPSSSGGSSGNTFLAEMRWFAGNFAPGGWASTDGQLLPIAQNQAVFSLVGTIYGGNGTTNFALPDLRDRVAMHKGQGPGLTSRLQGSKLGTESEGVTVAQLAPHAHNVTLPVSAPALPRWGVAGLLLALTVFGARWISSSRSSARR